MDEATHRLNDVGLEWSLNESNQEREWTTDSYTGESGPYSGEIEVDGIDEEAISTYEMSYVDGLLSDEPRNAEIYRDMYQKEQ